MTSPVRARVRSSSRPARAPARSRPDLRVVRPARARRRRVRAILALGIALTVSCIFGVVAFNVFLVQSQFQLEQLEQEVQLQREEYERLRLEAARLASPDRILAIARQELGMVDPQSITHLTAAGEPDRGEPPGEGARAWAELKPLLASEP